MNNEQTLNLGTNDELIGTTFHVPGYEATSWTVNSTKDGWAWCIHEGSKQFFNAASVRLWQTNAKRTVNEDQKAGVLRTGAPAFIKNTTGSNQTKDNMSKEVKPKSIGAQLVAHCKTFDELKAVLLAENPNADQAFLAKQESQKSFGLQKMAIGAALTRFKAAA